MTALPNASAPPKVRVPFTKPSRDVIAARVHDDRVIVKLMDGTGIRLRGSELVIIDAQVMESRAQRQGLSRSRFEAQLAALNDVLRGVGASVTPLLSTSEAALREAQLTGERNSGGELPDLNLFFLVQFHGKSPLELVDVVDRLNQLEIVEYASPPMKLGPPPNVDLPPTTPSYAAQQTYFGPAPGGIDVNYARQVAGGRGETVRVVVVETGWIADHEDMPPLVSTSGRNYPVESFTNHGTAVAGVLAAPENAYGMTGIAPAAEVAMSSVDTVEKGYNLPDGMQRAYDQSRPGDVILIEQQVRFSNTDDSLCPATWEPAVLSIVQTAINNGRIVVETAGNGAQSLDAPKFGTYFHRVHDPGSIMASAGLWNTRAPADGTNGSAPNYGARVDVQGWWNGIYTLGYGDLFLPDT
ncbi:MAG TPA: S8 family serine peptidase, partial [Thermoanaerobaculia bacterium]